MCLTLGVATLLTQALGIVNCGLLVVTLFLQLAASLITKQIEKQKYVETN